MFIDELAAIERRERAELERRAERFRGDRDRVPLGGRTVIVVDDGIATGSTARAACQVARAQRAARVVLAVPVAPPDWTAGLEHDADELVCLRTPRRFFAIGPWYAEFSQTSDEEVVACLRQTTRQPAQAERPSDDPDFAPILVRASIDSISITPDSFLTVKQNVAATERQNRGECHGEQAVERADRHQ